MKHNFFKICKYSARLTESAGGDASILFWDIYNNIEFNRAIPTKKVVLHKSPEKTITDRATWSFTDVSKSLQLNFINKFTRVTQTTTTIIRTIIVNS